MTVPVITYSNTADIGTWDWGRKRFKHFKMVVKKGSFAKANLYQKARNSPIPRVT